MRVLVLLAAIAFSACSRPAALFVEQNARSHVEMLAGTIGSRWAGTPANAKARAYVIDQLKLYGFEVRVQETDARRAELGRTARVSNIIATLPGERPEAIGLLSHYDSGNETPGAGDDGFGVAVSLEAARTFAAREKRRWSLFVLVTDAEEAGLMGAAALVTDREVTDRLRAYLNFEAIGSARPVRLFETGPANAWLVKTWARHAPHPSGSSMGVEVYKRLPNDTDFTIFKRHDIPGLNFAVVGNSYVYHTARDTPERVEPAALRETGENVASILAALQDVDITQRSASDATYFDAGATAAISYGPRAGWLIAAAALALGAIALVKVTATTIALGGVARWLLTFVWALAAVALSAAGMVAATWALRAARESYHPWYAHPDRLLMLIAATGIALAWAATRVGAWLPPRAHLTRHPAAVWSVALPAWVVLATAVLWVGPAAAYMFTVPLLAAGLLLTIVPARNDLLVRVASIVVLAVAGTIWLRTGVDLSRFAVAVFGRLPVITPVFIYAALAAAVGLMVAPPFLAAAARPTPLPRPPLITALCLAAIAVAAGFAYTAPAYTDDRPLRRYVRAIQDADTPNAMWEVASTEPGLDLEHGAPGGWTPVTSAPELSAPPGRWPFPFVFRTRGPSLGPAPAQIASFTQAPVEAGLEVTATVVPSQPGVTITFVAPPGLKPARSNLPGIVRNDRWTASYVAPPPDGVVWRAYFSTTDAAPFAAARVVVTSGRMPGGSGWQSLPAWLPQERTVWTATAAWILAPRASPVAQPETLR